MKFFGAKSRYPKTINSLFSHDFLTHIVCIQINPSHIFLLCSHTCSSQRDTYTCRCIYCYCFITKHLLTIHLCHYMDIRIERNIEGKNIDTFWLNRARRRRKKANRLSLWHLVYGYCQIKSNRERNGKSISQSSSSGRMQRCEQMMMRRERKYIWMEQ